MESKVEIYKTSNNQTEIDVRIDKDTVWLSRQQLANLFNRDRTVISRHISNIFKEGELDKDVVCAKFAHATKHGAIKGKEQQTETEFYNLDVIISVGYRVKSVQGTQFRQWATNRLKDYLVKGYAINEKRLAQKQQEVEYLKTGIRIISRAIEDATNEQNKEVFQIFSKGLALLDDYDHEELDEEGATKKEVVYPNYQDYINLINNMYSEFKSDVFAKPKDNSFDSSINQIRQGFGGVDLYLTIEEKAANLLYLITKNHSFVDGNKRIAAACFVYFLEQNNALIKEDGRAIIENNTLAALTLFIATSKTEEADIVKRLVISILNRNRQ